MKKLTSTIADKLLTAIAKSFSSTACGYYCHRPEMPEELKK